MFDDVPPLALVLIAAPIFYFAQMAVLNAVDARARMARLNRTMKLQRNDRSMPKRSSSSVLLEMAKRIAINTSERFSIVNGGEAEASARLLRTAGFRGRDALLIYSFLKLLLPIGAVAFTWLWFSLDDASELGLFMKAMIALAAALMLSKLPDVVLKYRQKKRYAEAHKAFPDMLELLVIATEAGLSFGPAINRVARELNDFAPTLSFEVRQLYVELNVLPDRDAAWISLSERLPLSEISIFSNAMMQAERYGTPISQALRTLMRDQRALRLLRIEEQAGRIPALMTVPLILFIMPALFVVLIGPAALNILDNIMGGALG
ncbi:type II secretion system F family protein [Sulfitobacter sp. NFXS29]|uniref:type II secretion system F family protein n=1 Tax=Sulfitobacter sp. NFXS29 TaxID=2818438 RepID=UPI0032DF6DAF